MTTGWEDHAKWIGHPEVTSGRCGGQKTALPPWKPEMRRQGRAKPPAQGGARKGLGGSQSFIEGRARRSAAPSRVPADPAWLAAAAGCEVSKPMAGLLLGHGDSCGWWARLLLCYPLPGGHADMSCRVPRGPREATPSQALWGLTPKLPPP